MGHQRAPDAERRPDATCRRGAHRGDDELLYLRLPKAHRRASVLGLQRDCASAVEYRPSTGAHWLVGQGNSNGKPAVQQSGVSAGCVWLDELRQQAAIAEACFPLAGGATGIELVE